MVHEPVHCVYACVKAALPARLDLLFCIAFCTHNAPVFANLATFWVLPAAGACSQRLQRCTWAPQQHLHFAARIPGSAGQ